MKRSGKGHTNNPKGCPKGAHHKGRPSNDFRAMCQEALDEVGYLDFAKGLIAGVKFEGPFGTAAARPETRFEALKWLVERVHGKVKQEMEHSGKITLEALIAGSHAEGEE